MLSKRDIQTHASRDNLMTSASSRDSGAMSGTLAGISFVLGLASAKQSSGPRLGSRRH